MKHLLVLSFALCAAPLAWSQDGRMESERIARERSAVDARFAERKRECNALFAVNDCVSKATREKNAALGELRQQERLLDDAERQRAAAERLKAMEERNAERRRDEQERRERALQDQKERDARAAGKAATRAEAERPASAAAPQSPPGPPQPQGKARESRAPAGAQVTPEEAARNRAAHEARLREAEQYKKEVQDRLAKRAKPAASALPVPQ
jgi:colicin import membrane protein